MVEKTFAIYKEIWPVRTNEIFKDAFNRLQVACSDFNHTKLTLTAHGMLAGVQMGVMEKTSGYFPVMSDARTIRNPAPARASFAVSILSNLNIITA